MNVKGLWSTHLSTRRHRQNVKQQGETAVVEPVEASEKGYCAICRREVMPRYMAKHLQSPKHRTAEKYIAYKATLEEAEKNKHGVTISDPLDFGIVTPADAQKGVSMQFVIQTTVPASRIKIASAQFPSTTTSRS
jgi:helicase MOV-10